MFEYPIVTLLLLGIFSGSFLNASIYRIPRKISIVTPRSFCPNCKEQIAWWQNIPLLSFVLLRGKCYYCREKISWRYPLVELLTGIISLILYLQFGLSYTLLFYLLFFYTLIVLSFIDITHQVILNKILLFLIISGILLNFAFKIIPWPQAIAGALLAGIIIYLIRVFGQFAFKKESMGMGDVKLAVVCGFFIGWQNFMLALFFASLAALLVYLVKQILSKGKISQKISFAPYLGLGCLISVLFGQQLLDLYLSYIMLPK
jgi:leader peptidase (prepilin peptidase)/N-methyltransferase